MAVLRESPWYQEILQEGERQGEQRGRQEAGRAMILRLLNRRVGDLPPEIAAQVQALSLGQLERLGEALLDFTDLTDLQIWLQSHS
jgi:predicted transposase YdaD